MPNRVLETTLTGRNLLSPVLASAGRDVVAFNSTVSRANSQAGTSATTSASVQRTAAAQVVSANTQAAQSTVASSTRQTTAHRAVIDSATALATAERASASAVVSANTQISGAVGSTTATYQRSAASLREKLGLQALDGAAADRSAAANSRAAQSAAVFNVAIDGQSAALARETVASGASTRATAQNTSARDANTLAVRAQQSATGALATANGLLGTSLTPLTAGLGAVGLALAYGTYRGMDFDKSMSAVQAATQGTASELLALRGAATEAGAATQYSSTEAAGGITELAKAGVSTTNILNGGLTGALNLAAAGQMEVADAAELGATALSVFNLNGDQMAHVADLLAAGAGKAQGSVGQLGQALNQSALVANQTGLSIESTTGALALFAYNGLVGSDAGTSFKTMLQGLTPNSVAAATAMKQYNVEAYDAQGRFIGLEAFAGKLKAGLSGLTEEQRNMTLETIFGSDAVRAASVLYESGAQGVAEWASKVDDAGFAQRQAAQLTDNLAGDLERLGGAVDTAFTEMGDGAQGPLRLAVQALTALVNVGGDVLGFWNSLPGPVQAGVLALAGFLLLRGPLDSMFTTLSGKITGLATGMGMAAAKGGILRGVGAGLLGAFGGPVGLAVTGLTVGLSLLIPALSGSGSASDDAAASATNLTSALEQTRGAIDDTVRAAAAKDLVDAGLDEWAEKLGVDVQVMTDALLGAPGALNQVTGAFNRYAEALPKTYISDESGFSAMVMSDQARAALKVRDQFTGLAGDVETTTETQRRYAAATQASDDAQASAATTAEDLNTQLEGTKTAADAAKQQVDLLTMSLDVLTGRQVTMAEAEAAVYAAMAQATDALKDNGGAVLDQAGALNLQAENGRAALGVITDYTGAANQQIATMIEQGATTEQATAKDAELREGFLKTIAAMGITGQAAEDLATKYYGLPEERRTTIIADTAQGSLDNVERRLAELARSRSATISLYVKQFGSATNEQILAGGFAGEIGGIVHAYADGGIEPRQGGIPLTPMSGGVAQVVSPNTWRVIGDRVTDDEAFIPINGSPRSHQILSMTAERMGYRLDMLAAGGVRLASSGQAGGPRISETLTVSGSSAPSKAFQKHGINIASALAQGITGTAGEVRDASKKLAQNLLEGADAYRSKKSSLTEQLDRQRSAINEAMDRREEAEKQTGKGAAKAVADADRAVAKARATYSKTQQELKALTASYGVLADRGTVEAAIRTLHAGEDKLAALATRRQALASQLASARDQLSDAVKLRDDFSSQVRESALAFADLTDIDASSKRKGLNSKDLVNGLQARLQAITTFRGQLTQLQQMGLSKSVYEQLATAGVEAGGKTAAALLAGGAGAVSQVSVLQQQIDDAARGLGDNTATTMHQAGVDAATGLVNGLSAQSKQLEDAAEALADKLTAAVKKKLGIRSPSTVLHGVGVDTGQGLVNGLSAMRPAVAAEMTAMADTEALSALAGSAGASYGLVAGGRIGTGASSAASMPGYAPAGAVGIDYDRLASAITRAVPAGHDGPPIDMRGSTFGTERAAQDVGQELAYKLRTRGG